MRKWAFFALAWALILGGAFYANRVQTSGGTVEVTEVRIPADKGVTVSGLLYRPREATAQRPAPAILVSHGYINTREMQSPFAIELSRRGYVVLAMDMTGHGYSGGIVGTDDFGGPAALVWLRAQPFVDKMQIGMEGHSMGGGPVMAAAAELPDGYSAVVLEGSTPGLLGAKAPASPRNLAVVFGQYDEFAGLMWQVPKGAMVGQSKRLQALFGLDAPPEPGRIYGDRSIGTARTLVNPPVTHPWEHFSKAGVGAAIDWMQLMVTAPHPLSPEDQVWLGKEIGTLVAFLGFVALILATFDLVVGLPAFAALNRPAEPVATRRDLRWWLMLAVTAALPALTYFPLMKLGQAFFPMPVFPQWIQNQLLVWALGTAAAAWVVGLVLGRKAQISARWGPSLAAAAATMAVAYLSLLLVDAMFKVDYRFWVLGLKPLTAARATELPGYLLLWSAFFLLTIRGFAANLPVRGEGLLSAVVWGKIAMAAGFAVLVAWQYESLFRTGLLATPTEPLNVIVAIQFVPLLGVIGIIAAWTVRRTGTYVPGALICALLISWYVTSGTANHWAPGFKPQLPGASQKR